MTFDFHQIIGTEDSKQANFSSLCSRIIMKINPDAKPIDGVGGDKGIDTIIGEFNEKCQVFQHKYFIEKIGPVQRQQIEKSLVTAISHHQVTKWILILPKDLNPSELKWFQKLKQKYAPLEMDWWGKTKLQELLAINPDIAKDFQPKPPFFMVVVSKDIDIKNVSTDTISEVLNDAICGKGPALPHDILTPAAEDIKRRAKLKVLMWGPGPSGGDLYIKRCELRQYLQKLGHEAVFSEDIWAPDMLVRSGLNLSVAEFLQAKAYDYIICLMASPGSIGEVHDFAKIKKFAKKMMICIDSCHKSGYSAQGTIRIFEGLNGKIDWFESPTDIRDCHLATRVLDHIQKVAEAKQWEIATGGS
jgi:hypothetical protein